MTRSLRSRKVRYARRLRKRMTPAESVLWQAIRGRKCAGAKFRRQVPVAWYVVDFLCREYSVIIEIDGGIHKEQLQYDAEREQDLQERGFHILRFSNEQVLHNLPSVLSTISSSLTPNPSPSAPPTHRERGTT